MNSVYIVIGMLVFWACIICFVLWLIYKTLTNHKLMSKAGSIWRRTFIYQYYEYQWVKVALKKGKFKTGESISIKAVEDILTFIDKSPRFKTHLYADRIKAMLNQSRVLY